MRTWDKGPPGEAGMAIHTVEQLSPNQHRLPNGNLLCMNVPIARTGWLLYGPQEVPVKVGDSNVAYVERGDQDLFNDKTIASIQAAAVTDEHPRDDVTPANWNRIARGFALNVRRGTGADSDVLLADLMITNKDLIESIIAGKREVSLGYDANYTDEGNGIGRQFDIIGNHIALVTRGRCGPRCAIGDEAYSDFQLEEDDMTTQRVKVRGSASRVMLDDSSREVAIARQRFADAELDLHEALQKQMEQSDGGGKGQFGHEDTQHIHIHIGEAEPTVPEGEKPVRDALKSKKRRRVADEPDPDDTNGEEGFQDGLGDGDEMGALHNKVDALAQQVAELMAHFKTGGVKDSLTDGPGDDATPRKDTSVANKDGAGCGMKDKAKGKHKDEFPDNFKKKDDESDREDLHPDEGNEENESSDPASHEDDEDDEEEAKQREASKVRADTEDGKKKKGKGKDSISLAKEYGELRAQAEVLMPGFRTPTYDSAAAFEHTSESMCATRRRVLDMVYATADGAVLLQGISGSKDLDLAKLPCSEACGMFKAAAFAKAALNNARATKDSAHVASTEQPRKGVMTPAEINAANAAFWEKHPTMASASTVMH